MEFLSTVKEWKRFLVPVLLGGLGGYAYYYFIGCSGGTCPISSNPWISTTYGAVIGFFAAPQRKKDQHTNP